MRYTTRHVSLRPVPLLKPPLIASRCVAWKMARFPKSMASSSTVPAFSHSYPSCPSGTAGPAHHKHRNYPIPPRNRSGAHQPSVSNRRCPRNISGDPFCPIRKSSFPHSDRSRCNGTSNLQESCWLRQRRCARHSEARRVYLSHESRITCLHSTPILRSK